MLNKKGIVDYILLLIIIIIISIILIVFYLVIYANPGGLFPRIPNPFG
jgi:hypothetical protein